VDPKRFSVVFIWIVGNPHLAGLSEGSPPAEVVEFFRQYYGPANRAFLSLDEPPARQLREELEALWSAHNRVGNELTVVQAEYLEVIATRTCNRRVVEAADGEQALKQIGQTKPDILLLDLNMPVLDGFATLERIRQDPGLAALPVLAVTAYAMRGDRERILNSGLSGYLSKPIHSGELETELRRLFNDSY
jgi:CheY-like chemotaxis protein